MLNILQAIQRHSVTSFTLLQNGVKFRLVTGRDITAVLKASRKTSQNVTFTDPSVKTAQIVATSLFLLPEIFAWI